MNKELNIKCLGCGVWLQTDPNLLGYIPELNKDKKHCQRCFKLINYNQIDNSKVTGDLINKELLSLDLDKKVVIYHIVDILNLPQTISKDLVKHEEKVVFLINKVDCLPKKYNSEITNEYIVKTISSFGFKNPNIMYVSIYNKSSIKRLYNDIFNHNKENKKAIFVGKSNVGKSSLINALFKVNNLKPQLTVSPFINTTINLKKTKINKIEIIDTPGTYSENNILNHIDLLQTKKIISFDNTKQKNYFLAKKNSLKIENLALLNVLETTKDKISITFYLNNMTKIKRIKTPDDFTIKMNEINNISYNISPEWETKTFKLNPSKKHNISIYGLGLVSISQGVSEISFNVHKEVDVTLSEFAII